MIPHTFIIHTCCQSIELMDTPREKIFHNQKKNQD